eukprot:CAMPEP_0182580494 /NCGR_PEP_ID=MMETSP1324-20130603/47270_1 /TAXON_ID=236786 /ORGANISM="Florenciella sp., Strain RCC1587" /LENGTH=317 /DNA_ID=CAMNT_0024796743 /DNA_START=24 /DNA_END=977 /DNA_ORIENTATION=+
MDMADNKYGAVEKDYDAAESGVPTEKSVPQTPESSLGRGKIFALCAILGVSCTGAVVMARGGGSAMSTMTSLNAQSESNVGKSCGKSCDSDDGETTADLTFDDDALSGLICADFDDDGVYPSHFCNYGDSKTCAEKVVTSDNYNAFCGTTCNKQEERKVERGDTSTSQYTNSSWAVFCGWQAVANMQTACSAVTYGDDTTDTAVDESVFSPEKPESSNNIDPSTDYADRVQYGYVMGKKMDGCNLHAFCSACTEDDGTTINSNCKAMVDKYGKGALYDVTSFFNSMESFWCTDDVQGTITNGTFADEYGWDARRNRN